LAPENEWLNKSNIYSGNNIVNSFSNKEIAF
jgi:hypothetical protein